MTADCSLPSQRAKITVIVLCQDTTVLCIKKDGFGPKSLESRHKELSGKELIDVCGTVLPMRIVLHPGEQVYSYLNRHSS